MRTYLVILLMLVGMLSASAQVYVNDIDINETGVKYCELLAKQKFLSSKIIVLVDYGQAPEWKSPKIRDRDGKSYKFETVIGALNFMDANGWEYVNQYALTEGNNHVYHFLLKREGT